VKIDYGPLLTDRYQLTMLQAYWQHEMHGPAVFEFFVRKLPPERNFLVAAGLQPVLEFLEEFAFSEEDIDWLAQAEHFRPDFLHWLKHVRFTGDVNAMPEGTVFFPNEPILQIIAPLPEAQLVETRLINLLNFQTAVASKAARSVLVAPGKLLVEFGLRRAHGADAALMAARACYMVGFQGTSNVLAGRLFDIPLYGTMAHSFIQAHDDEAEAFENFADANSGDIVLLIDTYDTEAAAEKVTHLAAAWKERGIKIKGVRIDSGDLDSEARKVRAILDKAQLRDITIFASGNLDEYVLRDLVEAQTPIDGFGIGTKLDTSSDAPYLNCAYKLQEYAGRPRRKHSEGKATWPGRKQVTRALDDLGRMTSDVLAFHDETPTAGLLVPVMRKGKRLAPPTLLADVRQYATDQLADLPNRLRTLDRCDPYSVTVSPSLQECARGLDAQNIRTRTPKAVI
jgi:nicotinate phosphoribosyltransferase